MYIVLISLTTYNILYFVFVLIFVRMENRKKKVMVTSVKLRRQLGGNFVQNKIRQQSKR